MKTLSKLPRFKLNLTSILLYADDQPELLTYDSEIWGMAYAASTEGILILSASNGYLRIRDKDIGAMIGELQYISEDMKRRRQCR